MSTFPGQMLQVRERSQPARSQFLGVLVTQFVQREVAAIGDLEGATHRRRRGGKLVLHVVQRAQVMLGVGQAEIPGVGDRGPVADGRQDIVQRHAAGMVVEHVAGRQQGDLAAGGFLHQPFQFPPIVRATMQRCQQVTAITKQVAEPAEHVGRGSIDAWLCHRRKGRPWIDAFRMVCGGAPCSRALRTGGTAAGYQPGQ